MRLVEQGASRPPSSVAERDMGVVVARRMRRAGWRPATEGVRVATSPTWAPLLRALLRLWAAAFLAAGWPFVAIGLAGAAAVGAFRPVADLVRFLPVLGARSNNVVASRRGTDRDRRPIVVVAHLDTHPSSGTPLTRAHRIGATVSSLLALIAGALSTQGAGWRPVAGLVAIESVLTLAWLARAELATIDEAPDDNTSGLLALARFAELTDGSQLHDLWLVATTGATSGSRGITAFLKARPALADAWVVEFDALGTGEVIASPHPARYPHPGTPQPLIRAVAAAAKSSGDPLTVRRVRRPHSDARAALRARVAAITLTEGLRPPSGRQARDPGNAERAARIVDTLARIPDAPTNSVAD